MSNGLIKFYSNLIFQKKEVSISSLVLRRPGNTRLFKNVLLPEFVSPKTISLDSLSSR